MAGGFSALEWIAAGLGVVCVALVALRSIWNFPFAIASVGLYVVVFHNVLLLSDALLQVIFVVTNIYGWAAWLRSGGGEGAVVVERLSPRERVAWLAAIVAATWLWGALMAAHTNAQAPYWDAAVAIPSVAAQLLLAQRRIENWLGWIAVDLIAIPLYAAKGLYPTAGLYAIYLVLSVWGLADWTRAGRHTPPHPGPMAA